MTITAEIVVTGAVTATINCMHVCSGTSADYTVTLPAASGNTGNIIGFRMAPIASLSKLVTLDGNASETIDGATTRVMWAGESCILLCDGSNWFKIAGNSIPMYCAMSSSGTTSCSSGVATVIPVNTTSFNNTGLMADASTNHRINIVRANKYLSYSDIEAANVSLAGTTGAYVYKNGSSAANRLVYLVTNANEYTNFDAGRILDLAVNDYIESAAVQYSGGSVALRCAQLRVQEILSW